MEVSLLIVALAMLLACLGAIVQGTIGFGLGVVVTPVLAIFRPELVPVASLLAAGALPIGTLIDEWRHFHFPTFAWIFGPRIPGTLLGAWLVTQLPLAAMQVTVALIVLLMVGLSAVRLDVPRNRGTLMAAGLVSGTTGTATGIGGPPLAMVLINDEPARARATMAGLFLIGMMMSLVTLWLGGAVHRESVTVGALMAPMTIVGLLIARKLRSRIGRQGFRRGVFAASTVSALILLVQALT